MVMDDDPTVRHNRLSLLRAIADDFRHFELYHPFYLTLCTLE